MAEETTTTTTSEKPKQEGSSRSQGSRPQGSRPQGRPQGRGRGRGRRQYYSRPRVCQFCSDKSINIDYKDVELLKKFVTEHGKIKPRRATGTCAKHQRKVATAVKQARHIALLPFVSDSIR